MNSKRAKTLRAAYVNVMREQGYPLSHSSWHRFKKAFYQGRLTPKGTHAEPAKAHQIKILMMMGYTEQQTLSLITRSKTKLKAFIKKKNTRVISLTEVVE